MNEGIDTERSYKEALTDVLDIFRVTMSDLIRKRGRTLKRVILSKNNEGTFKYFKIEFNDIIKDYLVQYLQREKYRRLFTDMRLLKKDLNAQSNSVNILQEIIRILMPLREEKLKMINQVVKIICSSNNPGPSNDLSSLISSEDYSKTLSEQMLEEKPVINFRVDNLAHTGLFKEHNQNNYGADFLLLKKRKKMSLNKKRVFTKPKTQPNIMNKIYEMSDKNSFFSTEDFVSQGENVIEPQLIKSNRSTLYNNEPKRSNISIQNIQNYNNFSNPSVIPTPRRTPQRMNNPMIKPNIVIDYADMSSNSDIDSLLVNSQMDKQYKSVQSARPNMYNPNIYKRAYNIVEEEKTKLNVPQNVTKKPLLKPTQPGQIFFPCEIVPSNEECNLNGNKKQTNTAPHSYSNIFNPAYEMYNNNGNIFPLFSQSNTPNTNYMPDSYFKQPSSSKEFGPPSASLRIPHNSKNNFMKK